MLIFAAKTGQTTTKVSYTNNTVWAPSQSADCYLNDRSRTSKGTIKLAVQGAEPVLRS